MVSGWFSLRQDVDFPHFVYMAFVYLLADLDGMQSVACHVHIYRGEGYEGGPYTQLVCVFGFSFMICICNGSEFMYMTPYTKIYSTMTINLVIANK